MEQTTSREESFAFVFGALDLLANLKPNMQDKLRKLTMDMYRLTYPDSTYDDYKNTCNRLHKEKTEKLSQKMNGLILESLS